MLERLLSADSEVAGALRRQMDGLTVTGGCKCGCPTVHFREGNSGLHLVAEATNAQQDQTVLLFVGDDGVLESMELTWVTDDVPSDFPDPGSLTVSPPVMSD